MYSAFPAVSGVLSAIQNSTYMSLIRSLAQGPRYITSVCTGSLIRGAAGLLGGKRSCHWTQNSDLLNAAEAAGFDVLVTKGLDGPTPKAWKSTRILVLSSETVWRANPENVEIRHGLGLIVNNQGMVLRAAGKMTEAGTKNAFASILNTAESNLRPDIIIHQGTLPSPPAPCQEAQFSSKASLAPCTTIAPARREVGRSPSPVGYSRPVMRTTFPSMLLLIWCDREIRVPVSIWIAHSIPKQYRTEK